LKRNWGCRAGRRVNKKGCGIDMRKLMGKRENERRDQRGCRCTKG